MRIALPKGNEGERWIFFVSSFLAILFVAYAALSTRDVLHEVERTLAGQPETYAEVRRAILAFAGAGIGAVLLGIAVMGFYAHGRVGAARRALAGKIEELGRFQDWWAFTSSLSPVVMIGVDADGIILFVRGRELRSIGMSAEEAVGQSILALYAKNAQAVANFRRMLKGEEFNDEVAVGDLVYDVYYRPKLGPDRRVLGGLVIAVDITRLKRIEAEAGRHLRAFETLALIDRLIVAGEKDEQVFLETVCDKLVEIGGYRFVWIGRAENDAAKTVAPLAKGGVSTGYLAKAAIRWSADDPRGRGPTGKAIRTLTPSVCRDILNDPEFAPWRPAALENGFQSSCAVPFKVGDDRYVLNVYAAEPHAFDEEGVRLLELLATDIGRSLVAMRSVETVTRVSEEVAKQRRYADILLDNSLDIILICDPKGVLKLVSPAVERILGYLPSELVEKSGIELVQPDDRPKVLRLLEKAVTDPDTHYKKEDARILTKSGDVRTLEFAGKLLPRETGISGILMVARDVTERLKSEEALRKSEERYRLASRAAKDVIWEWDLVSDTGMFGETFKEIFGHPQTNVEADWWREHIHPDDRGRVLGVIDDAMARHADGWSVQYRFRKADGTYAHVDDRASIVYAQDGKPMRMVGAMTDVTARVTAQERERTLAKLKSKFVTLVAHQMRTPLSAVRWNLETILAGELGKLRTSQEEFLKMTYVANGEIITTINDFLVAIDIEEGRMTATREPLSFEGLWHSVFANVEKECVLKGLKLSYAPPAKPLRQIIGDSRKLRLVLEKLADNAVKYTMPGGSITVRILSRNGVIRFEIRDTGIGIPEAEQGRIFERFYRATNANHVRTNASGIGLYIAKHFVELHGGKIGFRSTEGKGSEFWFELPVARD